MRAVVQALSIVGVVASWSSGAVVPISGSGANSTAIGSHELQTLTLNNRVFTRSELTQVTLTSFVGGGTGVLLVSDTGQSNGANITRTAAQRRALLEDDWRFDTGIINPSTDAGAVGVSFKTPVVNGPGTDLVLFEIQTGTPDAFDITINGVKLTVTGAGYGNTGYTTSNADVLNTRNSDNTGNITVSTLAGLLSAPLQVGSNNIAQTAYGVGIDFSDFNVPLNQTVTSFTVDSNGATFDPVLIVGVPEPTTFAAMVLLGIPLLRRRR